MKKSLAILFCLLIATGAVSAQQKFLTIATGGTAGTYFPLGGAMAEIWNKNIPKMNANATATGASAANVAMLAKGEVDVIFTQNDIAYYALNDLEILKGKGTKDIRGLACLYNETVQVVALADSGIKSVSDLKGKRVGVGAAGSGTVLNAQQVLEAAGISFSDIKVQYLSFAECASNLKDGNIDAAFNVAGAPTGAIQDLGASKKIQIVAIDGDVAKKPMAKYSFYTIQKIPSGTYIGQSADVTTVAVKSMLAVSSKLDATLVYDLLKTMFANGERLAASHKISDFIQSTGAGLRRRPFLEYAHEAGKSGNSRVFCDDGLCFARFFAGKIAEIRASGQFLHFDNNGPRI
ncbi:MAG: TAXI family TRAP transporter solute-binding subunit [Spirochaetes bacterium]|nr:TAXI family TRAP transporter solute-binding subunit [Spirochaetota bacterium]